MPLTRRFASFVVVGLLLPAITASAASVTLRRGLAEPTFYPAGYTGAADNTLFYFAATTGANAPSVWMRSSDGANSKVRAVANSSSNERTLYRFDLSAMSNQNIVVTGDATLTLTSAGGATGAEYRLYQIASANAGWTESTNNAALNPSSATTKSHDGDPTWWYKSIDNATYAATTGINTSNTDDITSIKWASGQTNQGNPGSNPESYANTGGLWNSIDLVDHNRATVASNYLTMGNMDPVATGILPAANATVSFTIPGALVQNWLNNPARNAGLLGRYVNNSTGDFFSSEASAALRPTLTFDYEIGTVVPGDFNGDNVFDQKDYVLWRKDLGQWFVANDYDPWRASFNPPPGSGIAIGGASAVPEPSSIMLCTTFVALFAVSTRRRKA